MVLPAGDCRRELPGRHDGPCLRPTTYMQSRAQTPLPLLQAKWSKIDFDYLQYAQLRWGEYFRRKDEFLSAAARLAPPRSAGSQ